MKFRTQLFIIFLTLFFASIVSEAANRFDEEEKLRREIEKTEEYERREREAARKRYDKEHSTESDSGSSILCLLMGVGIVVIGIKAAMQSGGSVKLDGGGK